MAILSKIRQRTVFLIVIIALALFSFVLADVIRQGGFTSTKSMNTIGVVGDREISREEFAQMVENRVQQSQGRVSTIQAVNQIWDSKVFNLLLDQELDKLGLEVGSDQITNAMEQQLAGNPTFSNEAGFFDPQKVKQYVAEIKISSPNEMYPQWLNFEKSIETIAKAELYYDMIRAGIGATKLEAEQAFKKQNASLDLSFVRIPFDKAADVEVSKADIKDYINKNKSAFKQEAERDIKYVYFKEESSAEDIKGVETDLKKLLDDQEVYNSVTKENEIQKGLKTTDNIEEFVNLNSDVPFADRYFFEYQLPEEIRSDVTKLEKGEVFGPHASASTMSLIKMIDKKQMVDSVSVKHILVTYEGTNVDPNVTRTQEEAKALADSITNVINKDADKFAEMATSFSADKQSAENGGDLGWVTYGSLVDNFNDYVFSKDAGHKGVVETDFGYHVVHVTDKKDKKQAYKIARIVKSVEASDKTLNTLYRNASNFELAAKESSVEEAAKEANLDVVPVNKMNRLDETISQLGKQRNIVKWAFEESTNVGDISRFDISGGYVIAELVKKTPEGVKTAEEASETVTPIIKANKQAKEIMSQIDSNDLDAVASQFGVSVQDAAAVNMGSPVLAGAGREPKVVGAAFALETNEVSQAVQGEKGVYLVKLLAKQDAPELPSFVSQANRETQKRVQSFNQKLQRLTGENNINPVYKALKETSEIEDNRSNFY